MAIAARRPRGGGDGNGLGLLRSSVERRRIANARTTARRQRMWEDARLQRQEEEKRAALHILERRKKERARLSSYIYSAISNHHQQLKSVSEEGSPPTGAGAAHKSAPFKQKASSSAEISTRNSRLGGASSKCASQLGVHVKESKQNQAGNSSNLVVAEQKSKNMRDSAGVLTILNKSPPKATQNKTFPRHKETGCKSVAGYISGPGASISKNTSWKNEPVIPVDIHESENSLPTPKPCIVDMSAAKQEPTVFTSPTNVLKNTSEVSLGSNPSLSIATDLDHGTPSSTTQILSEEKMDDFLESALQERLENETSTSLLIAELTGLKNRLEDCKFRSLVENTKPPLLSDAFQVSHGKRNLDMDQKILAASVSVPTAANKIRAVYENTLKSSKLAALNMRKGLTIYRNFSKENLKRTREEVMLKNEHAARTRDADRPMPHIQDGNSGMENSKVSDTEWKSKAGAILCKAKENVKDNTELQNVEACTPFSGKNTNMHMLLVQNNDLANETFMVKHQEGQLNHSNVKDCEKMKTDGGLCFSGKHAEMLVMDASMNIKPSSRSTLHSRKSFPTSLHSSESSQCKRSDQLPPVKHGSALAYRKDKRLILQSLRNRQKKNLINLSEKEKSLLASIERLDVKLASTKGDGSSISMISDENSVKSAPTVMERLGSRQGSKPWKILRHPLRPLSSLSAALPLKRRQNVGLTNKSRENTNCSCSHSSEPKECQSSFLGPQLEAVQPATGTIHIHQDPRFLLSP